MSTANEDELDFRRHPHSFQVDEHAWTRIGGAVGGNDVKTQIDYVLVSGDVTFHGGVRQKLKSDHCPITYDLILPVGQTAKKKKDKPRPKTLTWWKPLDDGSHAVIQSMIAEKLVPTDADGIVLPKKLLSKSSTKRTADGSCTKGWTPCLKTIGDTLMEAVKDVPCSTIGSRRSTALRKPEDVQVSEMVLRAARKHLRVAKGGPNEADAKSNARRIEKEFLEKKNWEMKKGIMTTKPKPKTPSWLIVHDKELNDGSKVFSASRDEWKEELLDFCCRKYHDTRIEEGVLRKKVVELRAKAAASGVLPHLC